MAARLKLAVVGIMLAAALGAGDAWAQEASYTDLSQFLISSPATAAPSPVPGVLSSTIVQAGQGNNASSTLSGTSNITTQYQSGAYNTSALVIAGTQNAIANTQIGNNNTAAISINGNNNSISNLQVGSNLSYQLSVTGTQAPVSVQQYGVGKK